MDPPNVSLQGCGGPTSEWAAPKRERGQQKHKLENLKKRQVAVQPATNGGGNDEHNGCSWDATWRRQRE